MCRCTSLALRLLVVLVAIDCNLASLHETRGIQQQRSHKSTNLKSTTKNSNSNSNRPKNHQRLYHFSTRQLKDNKVKKNDKNVMDAKNNQNMMSSTPKGVVPSQSPSPTITPAPTLTTNPTLTASPTLLPYETRIIYNNKGGQEYVAYCGDDAGLPQDAVLVDQLVTFQYSMYLMREVTPVDPALMVDQIELYMHKAMSHEFLQCSYNTTTTSTTSTHDSTQQEFYVNSLDTSSNDVLEGTCDQQQTVVAGTICYKVTADLRAELLFLPNNSRQRRGRQQQRRRLQPLRRHRQAAENKNDKDTTSDKKNNDNAMIMDSYVVKTFGDFFTELFSTQQWNDNLIMITFDGFKTNPTANTETGGVTGSNNNNEAVGEGGSVRGSESDSGGVVAGDNQSSTAFAGATTESQNQKSRSGYSFVFPVIAVALAILVLGLALFVVRHKNKRARQQSSNGDDASPSKNTQSDESAEQRNQTALDDSQSSGDVAEEDDHVIHVMSDHMVAIPYLPHSPTKTPLEVQLTGVDTVANFQNDYPPPPGDASLLSHETLSNKTLASSDQIRHSTSDDIDATPMTTPKVKSYRPGTSVRTSTRHRPQRQRPDTREMNQRSLYAQCYNDPENNTST